MSRKLLKSIIITTIALIALYVPKCYAAGASISTSTTTVKPGETVELYIDLSTASIGYDLQITSDNDDLISSSEVVSKIGSGTASRIYLVQLTSSEDRITHSSGTRVATIKYTIAETATVGSTITLNVSGDVAGETSADKNEMDESVTMTIVEPSNSNEDEENPEQEENPPQEEGSEQVPEQDGEENSAQDNENKEDTKQDEKSEESQEDGTIAKDVLPDAGVKGYAILTVMILIAIMYSSFKKYNMNKDIK